MASPCFVLVCLLVALAIYSSTAFHLGVMVCVWGRPLLADLVLRRLAETNVEGVKISVFVIGSEGARSKELADKCGHRYIETRNKPLGRKHNVGLKAMRDSPIDAVSIIGSDDIVNAEYFRQVRAAMVDRKVHIFGLRDVYFLDLASETLAYTPGYRVAETAIAASVGLGRAFSRQVLDHFDWHLWDDERDRGLDQSAVRRVLNSFPLVNTVSESIIGRDFGVIAVDIKTKGLEGGENIWSFEDIKRGSGKDKNLQELVEVDLAETLNGFEGMNFSAELNTLREKLIEQTEKQQAEL